MLALHAPEQTGRHGSTLPAVVFFLREPLDPRLLGLEVNQTRIGRKAIAADRPIGAGSSAVLTLVVRNACADLNWYFLYRAWLIHSHVSVVFTKEGRGLASHSHSAAPRVRKAKKKSASTTGTIRAPQAFFWGISFSRLNTWHDASHSRPSSKTRPKQIWLCTSTKYQHTSGNKRAP